MTEKELLERFNVSICEFDSSQWPRDGFLDPVNRVVYINKEFTCRKTFEGLTARIRAPRTQPQTLRAPA